MWQLDVRLLEVADELVAFCYHRLDLSRTLLLRVWFAFWLAFELITQLWTDHRVNVLYGVVILSVMCMNEFCIRVMSVEARNACEIKGRSSLIVRVVRLYFYTSVSSSLCAYALDRIPIGVLAETSVLAYFIVSYTLEPTGPRRTRRKKERAAVGLRPWAVQS